MSPVIARPWLDLYGYWLKARPERHSLQDEIPLAPIQEMLHDELLHLVLGRLSPYTLGSVACTCRHWRALVEVKGVTESLSEISGLLMHVCRPLMHAAS